MLAGPGDWTNILYHALAAQFIIEAVIVERSMSRASRLRRRATRLGLFRVLDQAAFSLLVVPFLRARAKSRIETLRAKLKADVPIPDDRVIHVDSVNSEACVAELRRLSPSVVVVSGTRVISGKVIDSIPAPFVNMHAGITPHYRGVHGGYWALADGRPESAGVTVHLIDEGIDTGGVLGQARIEPENGDSFVTYPYLQIQAGIPLLVETIKAARAGRLAPIRSIDATESKLWYHPGAIEYLVRRARAGVR